MNMDLSTDVIEFSTDAIEFYDRIDDHNPISCFGLLETIFIPADSLIYQEWREASWLCQVFTSTSSERAFSGGRQLITDFRCRLNGETITATMLLKDWIKNWDNVIETNH